MTPLFWSAMWALGALLVMRLAIALFRGREREDEAVTMVRVDCCGQYRGIEDVVSVDRPWISFECKDPQTCKRRQVVR